MLQAAEQDYEKEKLNERIAKLSGGVAVIQVSLFFLMLMCSLNAPYMLNYF